MGSRIRDSPYFFLKSKKSPGGKFAPNRRYYIAYNRGALWESSVSSFLSNFRKNNMPYNETY